MRWNFKPLWFISLVGALHIGSIALAWGVSRASVVRGGTGSSCQFIWSSPVVSQPAPELGSDHRTSIRQFLSEDDKRYFDSLLGLKVMPKGRRLKDSEIIEFNLNGESAFAFFEMAGDGTSPEYLATFGLGIVSLKVLKRPASSNQQKEWQRRAHFEEMWPAFLSQHQIAVSQYFTTVRKPDEVIIVKNYTFGPTMDRLIQLYEAGKIDWSVYSAAEAEYQSLMSQLAELSSQLPQLKLLTSHRLIDQLPQFQAENIRYEEGKWTVSAIPDFHFFH